MPLSDYADRLDADLLGALEGKGFTELTPVQVAVLDAALEGRDLRVTSQTGSGKTIAIGLSLRALTAASADAGGPRALVIAPTRELAHQVEEELRWLYAGRGTRLATTTGGSSYRDEHRALARKPAIVVGTPGRLLDHLTRGSIDASHVQAVVLDEADRMLDLGFRDDLLAIFAAVPAERQTHLVSATFPRMVQALADRVQHDPVHVEGTRLGAANVDIDHVIHVVAPDERLDALINLLLAKPDEQTLVFVRMRADATHVANELVMSGFAASALSGEMDQSTRNRTLATFKQGGLRVLVATDVAARGIDAQNVTCVVHAELPTDPDAYTHRSGRTGRAGRKGTSAMLVAPIGLVRAIRLLRQLGVPHRVEPVPTPEEIDRQTDERLFAELTADAAADGGELSATDGEAEPARWSELAQRLIAAGEVERTLTRLLARSRANVTRPRRVRVFAAPPEKLRARDERRDDRRDDRRRDRRERRTRDDSARPPSRDEPRGAQEAQTFVPFRVTWGREQGADPRRMLAMVCRRGKIRGRDVGAIRIDASAALVEVEASVAAAFEREAGRRDPSEPGVVISRQHGRGAATADEARGAARPARKDPQARAADGGKHPPRRKAGPKFKRRGA